MSKNSYIVALCAFVTAFYVAIFWFCSWVSEKFDLDSKYERWWDGQLRHTVKKRPPSPENTILDQISPRYKRSKISLILTLLSPFLSIALNLLIIAAALALAFDVLGPPPD